MNLPPFVYAKAFWEALSVALAGLFALLAFFGVVDSSWAVPAATIAAWFYSLLRLFGVEPELRARATLLETQKLLREVQNEVYLAKSYKANAVLPPAGEVKKPRRK